MSTQAQHEERDDRPTEDHSVRLHGVTWDHHQRLLAMRGEGSAPRIAYLEGEVEIMRPSRTHAAIKSLIGPLVEAYCLGRDIPCSTHGSWTLQSADRSRGAEPDECCVFGTRDAERPHLVIEVVWTAGSASPRSGIGAAVASNPTECAASAMSLSRPVRPCRAWTWIC